MGRFAIGDIDVFPPYPRLLRIVAVTRRKFTDFFSSCGTGGRSKEYLAIQ